MKSKLIILGIVLCVLSSAPLKADPDDLDSATISGTYELSSKSVPEPGALTLITVGVLMTLILWEKVKFDRGHKDNQNARREAYWQGFKRKNQVVHKMAYRPPVEEVEASLKETRSILFPLASHLKVQAEDINSFAHHN